jgi:anti-sigma-K factor RskA
MMTHEQVSQIAGAFALDAVDGDEYQQVVAHLSHCPRCRAEVDAHLEMAAALGNSVEPLPLSLWSNISSRLSVRDNDGSAAITKLWSDDRSEKAARPGRAGGPHSWRTRAGGAASIAAVAAIAVVLGVGLVNADDQVAHLQGAIGETAHLAVVAALETPGHKVVELSSSDRVELAEFVVLPSGQGYLTQSHLRDLSSHETYQLWNVMNGQTISLGLLGRKPRQVSFTLAGVTSISSRLGITVEPAGGSVLPSGPMLASGAV